jgi:hypothetical protein
MVARALRTPHTREQGSLEEKLDSQPNLEQKGADPWKLEIWVHKLPCAHGHRVEDCVLGTSLCIGSYKSR